jgi:uncharacterized protein (DUF1330 family)
MPKGYWIGHITLTDPERYEEYKTANAVAFSKYGGRFIVRGGQFATVCGSARERHVVIEFDSYTKALECHNSPEYKAASELRDTYSENDIIIIEGV